MPRAARERQLLAAAERLFVARGYDATSIEDVARAAGVTRPVVYHHFGDKPRMFLACVRQIRRDLDESLERAVEHAQPGDLAASLRLGGDAYFAVLERDPQRWLLMLSTISTLFAELDELRVGTVNTIAALGGRLQIGRGPGSHDAAAHVISGTAEQLGRWWIQHPEVPRERVVDYFVRFLLHGLDALEDVP